MRRAYLTDEVKHLIGPQRMHALFEKIALPHDARYTVNHVDLNVSRMILPAQSASSVGATLPECDSRSLDGMLPSTARSGMPESGPSQTPPECTSDSICKLLPGKEKHLIACW